MKSPVSEYQAAGQSINRVIRWADDYSETESLCTLTDAVGAYLHMLKGPAICQKRGDHDYSVRVPQTTNMYLCFRCGEPGWEMP